MTLLMIIAGMVTAVVALCIAHAVVISLSRPWPEDVHEDFLEAFRIEIERYTDPDLAAEVVDLRRRERAPAYARGRWRPKLDRRIRTTPLLRAATNHPVKVFKATFSAAWAGTRIVTSAQWRRLRGQSESRRTRTARN